MLTNEEILAIARETVSRLFKEKELDGIVRKPEVEVIAPSFRDIKREVSLLSFIVSEEKGMTVGNFYVPSQDELIEAINGLGLDNIIIKLGDECKMKCIDSGLAIVDEKNKISVFISDNCKGFPIELGEIKVRWVEIRYNILREPPLDTYIPVGPYVRTSKGLASLPVAETAKNKIIFYGYSKDSDPDNIVPLDRKRVECTAVHEVAGHYLPENGILLVKKCIRMFYGDKIPFNVGSDERVAECITGVLRPDCIDIREQIFRDDESRPLYNYKNIAQEILARLLPKFPNELYYKNSTNYVLYPYDVVELRKRKIEDYRIGMEAAKKIIEKG